jgi:hypothetical protein
MRLSKWCWSALCLAGIAVWLCLPSPSFAQDRGDSKKTKGAKSNVIEIDLNTLPPDLAKRLLEFYVKSSSKKDGSYNRDDGDNRGAKAKNMKERDDEDRDERDSKKPKAKSKERDDEDRDERDSKKPKAKNTKERDEDERDERDSKKPQAKRDSDNRGQPNASMAQRLADLEQRLDQLVRDLSALRKDLGKKK